jgi:transcriptional regulator of acetoin/glycerol metabolism
MSLTYAKDGHLKTIEESLLTDDPSDAPVLGLVEIFSNGEPSCRPIRIGMAPIELGRVSAPGVVVVNDDRVSRRHTRIAAAGAGVRITDLDSRNGTAVDGRRIQDETFSVLPRVLRIGQTLFRFTADLRPFLRGGVEVVDKQVIGPTLRTSREEVARASSTGSTVLITGPSGSGKELAARAFHVAGKREHGPFVAVNCAAIPTGLAEGLLFGAKKGSHSAANTDTDGNIVAADRGTLFLDEIAELDLMVQAKLLRVLEMREVLPLGASVPRKVDVQICCATLKDLRTEVSEGRFRGDLYFRMGRPEVRLPSLIERVEEMPPLALLELGAIDPRLGLHVAFLEAAALRAWPGNVREFLREVRQSARVALDAGRTTVEAKDLSATAGEEIRAAKPSSVPRPAIDHSKDNILATLQREKGNVTRSAKILGMHRNQLRRWLDKNAVDPKAFGETDESPTSGEAEKSDLPPSGLSGSRGLGSKRR